MAAFSVRYHPAACALVLSLFLAVSQKLMDGKVNNLTLPSPPMSTPALFKWRHFLPEIILLNVRWYCRYSLSYRDLEEMMQERGVKVDPSTSNRWVLK